VKASFHFDKDLLKQRFSFSSNMLLNDNLISYLSVYVKGQNIYGTSSFRFNSSQKLVPNTAQKLKNERRKIQMHFLSLLLVLSQFLFGAKHVPLVIALENSFIIWTDFSVNFLKWTASKKTDDVIELFNLFTDFETQNIKSKRRTPCQSGKVRTNKNKNRWIF